MTADAITGRHRPRPHPTVNEVEQARWDYEHHVPSMTDLRICVAEGCGAWPCRPYRAAEGVLIRAGQLP